MFLLDDVDDKQLWDLVVVLRGTAGRRPLDLKLFQGKILGHCKGEFNELRVLLKDNLPLIEQNPTVVVYWNKGYPLLAVFQGGNPDWLREGSYLYFQRLPSIYQDLR